MPGRNFGLPRTGLLARNCFRVRCHSSAIFEMWEFHTHIQLYCQNLNPTSGSTAQAHRAIVSAVCPVAWDFPPSGAGPRYGFVALRLLGRIVSAYAVTCSESDFCLFSWSELSALPRWRTERAGGLCFPLRRATR